MVLKKTMMCTDLTNTEIFHKCYFMVTLIQNHFCHIKLSVLSQVSRISDRKQGEAGLTEIHTFLNTMFGGEYFFSAANENM